MLTSLIDKLEKIEYKLMKIKTEGFLADCTLSQERCRSLTNMVNILSSLANKTTQNKNYEDDVALCHDQTDRTRDELTISNLSSSEEFLEEVKNVLKSMPVSSGEIHTYLSNFQELLGDLVFTICEINNCQMKHASGIKVKDLVTIKNLYSTYWELLSSMFYPSSSTRCNTKQIQRNQSKEQSSEVNIIASDLVKAVESCLKEMSKVKLHIEHYVKFNLIELHFDKPEDQTKLENVVDIDKNKTANYLKSQDDIFIGNDINKKNNPDVLHQEFPKHGDGQQTTLNNTPPTQTGSQENYLSSCLYSQNLGGWDKYYDCKFVEDSYGHLFNAPIIYPPDVLFFDPPTVVFKSQMEPARKHSLPKIYSVDSMNFSSPLIDENIENSSDEKTKIIPPLSYDNKKENIIDKTLYENTDEDLFSECLDSKQSEAEYVQLKEKISSLLSIFRTTQINYKDDIFETNPLKIEKRDSSCSQQPKAKKNKVKVKKKKYSKDKHLRRNTTSQLQDENKEKQRPEIQRNKNKISIIQNTSTKCGYTDVLKRERLCMEYPMQFWAPNKSEVIYDRKSVVELYKSNAKECINEEQVPTQASTFCLWPVAGEYIYVSKGTGPENVQSVSSSTSISLAKSFEKSFFSLQMNKKYEQNQLYDGDLIVLDHTQTLHNKRDSTYSLCNQSSVVDNEHPTIENNDIKHLYSRNCADTPDIKNGKMIYFKNPLVPTDHGALRAQQQTFAVHYADCGKSLMVNKNYKNEKIDFFNFNSYDDTQNWDSFISIMTSKIGQNTHINERRMFRKIVKNLGAESLHDNNLFGNFHTLTSSGGPFRLFDINGYPLTDSMGNVLKDPYGKSIVQLDYTGFPKDDIKVFDAAGNSPKDVNFDPTQKPQTNCIVVKLTDNFKRPLHLFDKYGRPLTDSNGKLLVNIHGRPLLRFDNFGRPNTDYRGGPLYTDNGFRWSYKTESLSKEQISNETLTSQKVKLQNDSTRDTSVSTAVTDEKFKSCDDSCRPDGTKPDNFAYVDSRNSEMWVQVENILQQHSKKTKVEVKPSEMKLTVNSVTVKQTPEVKEYLSSIIYHDEDVQKCTYYYDKDELKKEEGNMERGNHNVAHSISTGECKPFLEDKIDYRAKKYFQCNRNGSINLPLYSNLLLNRTNCKYLTKTSFPKAQLEYYLPSIFLKKNNICKGPQIPAHEDVLTENPLIEMSICRSTGVINNVPSTFTFKNHEYLSNLCNQVLKNKVESRARLKGMNTKDPKPNSVFNSKKDHFTDTTLSDFNSSLVSKYTNEIPLYTDSPAISVESHMKDPQILKMLQDIDYKFKKHNKLKNTSSQSRDLQDQVESLEVTKENNNEAGKEKRNEECRYEVNPKEMFKSSGTSEKTNTYIDIVNHGSNQYKINIKERMRSGFQSCAEDHFTYTNKNVVTNDTDYPERENNIIKYNNNIPEKRHIFQPIKHITDVYHGEYCRHFKNEKDRVKDSPFRFPSEEQVEKITKMNNEIDYVNEKNWQGEDQNKTNKKYYEKGIPQEFLMYHKHAAAKQDHLYPKLVKKPQRNYRDCNLVSFLGTPVKYVLNKLDSKLSSRHQGKENKHKHLKTVYEPYENEKKLKTLYHSSKANKKYLASTEMNIESKRGKIHSKYKENLLAFKSKSFSEIQESKIGNMSYSGSQETSDKYSPGSSSQYNKCSSDTVIVSSNKHTNPLRRNRRYEIKKPKNEQYSFETHYVHTSNTTNNHHHRRSEKSPKGYNKHTSKSPKNKTKTVKLFKKHGHSGKQKRTR